MGSAGAVCVLPLTAVTMENRKHWHCLGMVSRYESVSLLEGSSDEEFSLEVSKKKDIKNKGFITGGCIRGVLVVSAIILTILLLAGASLVVNIREHSGMEKNVSHMVQDEKNRLENELPGTKIGV